MVDHDTLHAFRGDGRTLSMALAQLTGDERAGVAATLGFMRVIDAIEDAEGVSGSLDDRERRLRRAAAWLAEASAYDPGSFPRPCPDAPIERWLALAPSRHYRSMCTGAATVALTLAEAVRRRWRFDTWEDLMTYVDQASGTLAAMLHLAWTPGATGLTLTDDLRAWTRAAHLSDMLIDRDEDLSADVDLVPAGMDAATFHERAIDSVRAAIDLGFDDIPEGGRRFLHMISAVQLDRVERIAEQHDRHKLTDAELEQVVTAALGAERARASIDALHRRF